MVNRTEQAIIGGVAGVAAGEVIDLLRDHSEQEIDKQLLYTQHMMQTLERIREHLEGTPECPDMEFAINLTSAGDWYAQRNGRNHLCILSTVEASLTISTMAGLWPFTLQPGWNQVDPPDQAGIRLAPGGLTNLTVVVYIGGTIRDMRSASGGAADDLTQPATTAFLINPSDTVSLPQTTRGISMATAGDLHVLTSDGTNVTIANGSLNAGIIHPLRVQKVFYTGTTAAGIWGFA